MIACRLSQAASLLLGLAVAVGLGCNRPADPGNGPIEPVKKGLSLQTSEDLAPATPPSEKAVLRLSGSPFEVDLKTRHEGSDFVIELLNHDAEFEREEYVDSFDGFRLKAAAGESYEPPIDLLRFPMTVGDKWQWNGKIKLNSDAAEAWADVETSEDTQYVGAVSVPAVRVRVTLRFASSPETEAERNLTFWFAPDRGLFKRQYDTVSIREPAP